MSGIHGEECVLNNSETVEKIWEVMRYEANKMMSFSEVWPLSYIKPADLAAAGFFYLKFKDSVQCAFCQVIIRDWVRGQKPIREHMRKSPECSFLISDYQNIPIMHLKDKSKPCKALEILKDIAPKHPNMIDFEKRLETFRGWPEDKPDVKDMAESELYYSGFDDIVVCFTCGGLLGNWEKDDDPLFEHRKFFSDCKYVQFIVRKKENYLLRVCKTSQKHVVEKISASKTTVSLEKVKDRAEIEISKNRPLDSCECKIKVRNSLLCRICMNLEMNIVFQPCGHLVACRKCVENLNVCPLCRRLISSKIVIFIS